MPESFPITVNGRQVIANREMSVAVAILQGRGFIRTSVKGNCRGPLCSMGICFECRATVNGVANQPTCQILCEPNMDVHCE